MTTASFRLLFLIACRLRVAWLHRCNSLVVCVRHAIVMQCAVMGAKARMHAIVMQCAVLGAKARMHAIVMQCAVMGAKDRMHCKNGGLCLCTDACVWWMMICRPNACIRCLRVFKCCMRSPLL
jgi:hypothetical protein